MSKQEEELAKIKAQIKKQQQAIKGISRVESTGIDKSQEYQKLQKQLTMAMSVKEKYEAIIKKVLENSEARELVRTMFKDTTEMDFINLIMKQQK